MNSEYNLGVLVGIVVGIIVVAACLWWNKKQNGTRAEFDERQRLIRGEIFQHAFFAVTAWNLLYWAIGTVVNHPFMVDGLSGLVGLFVGVAVIGVESILRDAFFSASSRPKSYVFLYIAVLLSQIPSTVINWPEMVQGGVLTYKAMPLVSAVTFLLILLALVVKLTRREPEED